MKFKFQNLELFYEEELFSIVEDLFTEFLNELFENEKHSRFRDILFRSGEDPTLPGNLNMSNLPQAKFVVTSSKISKAKQYVRENYGRTIRLKDVASTIGYAASTFSHFFSKNTGQSFITYVNLFRVEKASWLLHKTDETVAGIGYMTGFNSPHHFNDVFKQYKGMTPGEYRKLCWRNE